MSAFMGLGGRLRLRRFGADQDGVAAIEFAIVAPVLVLMLLGAATYFDIARDRARVERAAYAAADAVSRQETVDAAFLGLLKDVAVNLTKTTSSPAIRISSVSRPATTLKVDWSYAVGSFVPLQTADVPLLGYPVSIPVGGSTIIVETRASYMPAFKLFGASLRTHSGVSFAKPRTVKIVAKSD